MKIVRLAVWLGFGAVCSIGCGGNTPVISPLPAAGSDAAVEAGPVGGASDAGGLDARGGGGGADAGVEAGPVASATFTSLYASILVPSCSGGSCHDPGSHGGVSFVSQKTGYDSVHTLVMPGNAPGSKLYALVASGRMPPNGPMLSSGQLAAIASWIEAGALND